MDRKNLKYASKIVYYDEEPQTKDVSAAMHLSSNFRYDKEHYQKVIDGDRQSIYIYSRCGNPTERLFESQMAYAEGSEDCLATSSGMAAISTTIVGLLDQGDHIVSDWSTYSTTHEFFQELLPKFGIRTTFVNTADLEAVANAIEDSTKVIFFETLSNPIMRVPDIRGLVELTKNTGIKLIADNTFTSPYIIRPIELGVDIVVESATKFIGGHNDVLGGVIAAEKDFLEKIRWSTLTKLGGAISPFNAWLLLRSLQTLHVRVERQCKNSMKLAKHLEEHEKVEKVFYPGLTTHPQHEVARRQMRDFGAMICIKLKDEEAAVEFLDKLEMCCFAGSLGSVRTTMQVPATMAFLDVPPEERDEMEIEEGMVRISVGLEDIEDIISDIDRALSLVN